MKCTTVEMAIERYGHIDLASGHWPGSGQWIQMLNIPSGWFPNWHVMGTDQVVSKIACNTDMQTPLLAALKAVRDKRLEAVLKTYDGCFNIRAVRGSPHMSCHAYGLAIDLNAAKNPLGSSHGDLSIHPDFVKCFTDQGFDWGGNFKSRKDQMHFSYAWE